jgi:hypothetical protein
LVGPRGKQGPVSSLSHTVTQEVSFVISGFCDLEVACWPVVPKFVVSHPAAAIGILGRKNPQHAFLRRRSKAVGLMS